MPTLETDADIAALGRAFLARTLPKPDWTHAAHWAAALHLLDTLGPAEAARTIPRAIRAYNVATGVENTESAGYHETITQASLAAAARAEGAGPAARLHALLAGPCGRPDWVLAHWSRNVLFSPTARARWIAPDLAPLPFPAPL